MSNLVEVSFPGGKRVDAKFGETVIRTDQSIKAGGEASAPEPFALFLASIATCAGIYALGFCQSRKIPTDGMALTMHCEPDLAGKRYAKMTLELKLPPEFPEKYRDSIIHAMDSCAVKKHIIEPPAFEIALI